MRSPNVNHFSLAVLLAVAGCSKAVTQQPPPPPPQPTLLHTNYRVIGGVSMGALGASMIGLHHPEMFDAVVALGGPMDASYLGTHMIEHQLMAGFCTLPEIEAQLASNPAGLNDPSVMTCMHDIPGTISTEHTESFSHWQFTTSGGSFDRSDYLELFYDLTFAFGNLLTYNPDSPVAPQGVPESYVLNPPPDICTNPYRIKGKLSDPNGTPVYNLEYNPEGKYDAITFCDGEENPVYYCTNSNRVVDFCAGGNGAIVPRSQEAAYAQTFCGSDPVGQAGSSGDPAVVDIFRNSMGRFDPCREHTNPARVAIAFDYNGNGIRDYGEPIVDNAHERFDDVGVDGCPDSLEDGHGGCVSVAADSPYASGVNDPNGDDYDLELNPFGTENDWRYEQGEPFRDDGLDGVPGTGDYGEGNGVYDETPGLAKLHSYDPRSHYEALTEVQRHELDMYMEGGIRDVFNFGVSAQVLAGAVRGADPTRLDEYHGFTVIPSVHPAASEIDAHGDDAEWDKSAPNTLELYGNPDAGPAEIAAGDGDHVGSDLQAFLRFQFMESWVANRWPSLPLVKFTPTDGGPPDTFQDRLINSTFHSDALGADRDYAIYLPPGYFDPSQQDVRYPVLYFLHGYGQDAPSMAGASLALFDPPMAGVPAGSPSANGRKYIVVFPSGRCCFENAAGDRDCTLTHRNDSTWHSLCSTGSFYVNASGPTSNDAPRYEDSLLDLVQYVDATYRTLPAADVKAR